MVQAFVVHELPALLLLPRGNLDERLFLGYRYVLPDGRETPVALEFLAPVEIAGARRKHFDNQNRVEERVFGPVPELLLAADHHQVGIGDVVGGGNAQQGAAENAAGFLFQLGA